VPSPRQGVTSPARAVVVKNIKSAVELPRKLPELFSR